MGIRLWPQWKLGISIVCFGVAVSLRAAVLTNAPAGPRHFDVAIPPTAGAAREATRIGQRTVALKGVIDLPATFDPKKSCPVLLVCAPSGSSAVSAARGYTNVALAAGWIVVAVDGPRVEAQQDDSTFAWEMISSLLTYVRTAWPQSKQWPFACAGFSGGAKRAAMVAAQMVRRNDAVIGVFMGGCNEDRATLGYEMARPGPAFLGVPMFLSNGSRDPIAGMSEGAKVRDSMVHSGFRKVRLESFNGQHRLDTNALSMALGWFRAAR